MFRARGNLTEHTESVRIGNLDSHQCSALISSFGSWTTNRCAHEAALVEDDASPGGGCLGRGRGKASSALGLSSGCDTRRMPRFGAAPSKERPCSLEEEEAPGVISIGFAPRNVWKPNGIVVRTILVATGVWQTRAARSLSHPWNGIWENTNCGLAQFWTLHCRLDEMSYKTLLFREISFGILSTSAECCNPTAPSKSVTFRKHQLTIVSAIEPLQATFKKKSRSHTLAWFTISHPKTLPLQIASSPHPSLHFFRIKRLFEVPHPFDQFLSMHHNPLDRILITDEIDASTKLHQTPFITVCGTNPDAVDFNLEV